MSGIYIPNIKMPNNAHYLQILIAENGDMSYEYVSYNSPHMGFTLHKSKAIEVPTHGDLIHYLSVKNAVIKVLGKDNILWCDIMDEIDKLPVVIEASKEREC